MIIHPIDCTINLYLAASKSQAWTELNCDVNKLAWQSFTVVLAYLAALLRLSKRANSCHISSRGSLCIAQASPCITAHS